MNNFKNLLSSKDIDYEDVVELENLQILSLLTFDLETRELKTPTAIGYYREPLPDEYPLDLAKGQKKMIYSVSDPEHYQRNKACDYIMSQKRKPEFDFCTTRGVLKDLDWPFSEERSVNLVATKFKETIYIQSKHGSLRNQVRESFQFKLRQYVFVKSPQSTPNTDEPVDQRDQIYANFSVNLGKFKLLYSAEIPGVDNTEPLGDLKDPEVLKQINFSMVKVIKEWFKINWRTNVRAYEYILQAHLAGIKQLRLAKFNGKAIVSMPIETLSFAELLKFEDHGQKLQMRLQRMHRFLEKISQVMAHEDCPYTVYHFHIKPDDIRYEKHEGPTNYSFLDKEYIDFLKDLY